MVIPAINSIFEQLNTLPLKCRNDDLWKLCDKNGWQFHSGASRWCIVCNDWDFVLKFPRYDSTKTDYCAIECHNYEVGCIYGIERVLLPITLLFTTDKGLPVYCQEKMGLSWDDMTYQDCDFYSKLREKTRPIRDSAHFDKIRFGIHDPYRLNAVFVAYIIQLYGKRFMRAFEAWTHECKVNDLHANNVGIKNKKPILLDYAGYHERW